MAKSSRNVGKEFLKVLNVMSGSTGGGAERFFERISIALNKESKFEVRVVIDRSLNMDKKYKKKALNAKRKEQPYSFVI